MFEVLMVEDVKQLVAQNKELVAICGTVLFTWAFIFTVFGVTERWREKEREKLSHIDWSDL